MSNHIDRAAEVIHHEWVARASLVASSQDHVRAFAERLDAAGMLPTPAHNAEVIRTALRPLRDYARQKGNLSARVADVDTSELLQAMANDLNRLMDRIERTGGAER